MYADVIHLCHVPGLENGKKRCQDQDYDSKKHTISMTGAFFYPFFHAPVIKENTRESDY